MVGAQEIPEEIKGSEFEEVDVVLDCVCRRPWIEDTSIDPHSLRQLKVVYISPWSMYARQSSEITNTDINNVGFTSSLGITEVKNRYQLPVRAGETRRIGLNVRVRGHNG